MPSAGRCLSAMPAKPAGTHSKLFGITWTWNALSSCAARSWSSWIGDWQTEDSAELWSAAVHAPAVRPANRGFADARRETTSNRGFHFHHSALEW